jgi:hypothetical protein
MLQFTEEEKAVVGLIVRPTGLLTSLIGGILGSPSGNTGDEPKIPQVSRFQIKLNI